MVNYEVDPELLLPYLPAHTELDFFNDKCYISLVGFMFRDTKVWGLKWPFHVDFEEVNLRFYVKRRVGAETRRGVVFIKEIVSRPIITLMANAIYNEQYETMRMGNHLVVNDEHLEVGYRWKKGNWNTINVRVSSEKKKIAGGSKAEFITEHYWGYTAKNKNQSFEYAVEHPRWLVHEVKDLKLQCNFAQVYGDKYAFLNKRDPASVLMAEGSPILVRRASVISY
jgi:uncharacterized protein